MAEHGQQGHSAIPGMTLFPTVAQIAHFFDSPLRSRVSPFDHVRVDDVFPTPESTESLLKTGAFGQMPLPFYVCPSN
jgi:hypothetical protein